MNKRGWFAAALAAACAAALWAQGVIVCRACGREAKPGAAACAHCKAELPKPKAEVAAAQPAAPAADPGAEAGRAAAAPKGGAGHFS